MLLETLKTLLDRNLAQLRLEVESYQNESNLWKIQAGIANPAGNLCLHLVGNLNAFIGAVFGDTGYVRDREAEFSRRKVSRATLLAMIDQTRGMLPQALDRISPAQLEATYPLKVFHQETSTEYMLVHLTAHLAYHLGQVNYHRRLLDQ
jgi:hypothetical protein